MRPAPHALPAVPVPRLAICAVAATSSPLVTGVVIGVSRPDERFEYTMCQVPARAHGRIAERKTLETALEKFITAAAAPHKVTIIPQAKVMLKLSIEFEPLHEVTVLWFRAGSGNCRAGGSPTSCLVGARVWICPMHGSRLSVRTRSGAREQTGSTGISLKAARPELVSWMDLARLEIYVG